MNIGASSSQRSSGGRSVIPTSSGFSSASSGSGDVSKGGKLRPASSFEDAWNKLRSQENIKLTYCDWKLVSMETQRSLNCRLSDSGGLTTSFLKRLCRFSRIALMTQSSTLHP